MMLAVTMAVHAQHLEFMGIPINGTITSFQSKLLAKGCKLFKYNNQLPSGTRGFEGNFAGKDCSIYVFYNTKTKQVYKVRVAKDSNSLDSARSMYGYFRDLLGKKYRSRSLNFDGEDLGETEDEKYQLTKLIYSKTVDIDKLGDIGPNFLGQIILGIMDLDSYPIEYSVIIDYIDGINSEKNEATTLDDL